jgi:hypothetical protein
MPLTFLADIEESFKNIRDDLQDVAVLPKKLSAFWAGVCA